MFIWFFGMQSANFLNLKNFFFSRKFHVKVWLWSTFGPIMEIMFGRSGAFFWEEGSKFSKGLLKSKIVVKMYPIFWEKFRYRGIDLEERLIQIWDGRKVVPFHLPVWGRFKAYWLGLTLPRWSIIYSLYQDRGPLDIHFFYFIFFFILVHFSFLVTQYNSLK